MTAQPTSIQRLEPEEFASHALEARVDPRVAADLEVEIASAGFSGPLFARTRDLSRGGLCVATPCPIALREIRGVTLRLPHGRALELPAEGRWQSTAKSGEETLTSVQFHSVSPEGIASLERLVNEASTELAHYLRRTELGSLPLPDLEAIAHLTRYRRVEAGNFAFRQHASGDAEGSLFLVRDGRLRVEAVLGSRRLLTIARLEPGSLFGGLGVIVQVPNPTSVYADEDATLIEISPGSAAYLRLAQPLLAQHLSECAVRLSTQLFSQLLASME